MILKDKGVLSEKKSNIELFNAIAGKIFADLYQNFPNEVEIKADDFFREFIDPEDFDGGFEISRACSKNITH